MLVCPVCRQSLLIEEKRAVCPSGHAFDRAREGYFNFLLSSSAGGHGDDKAMLLARRAFLEKGYYQPLCQAVQTVKEELFSPEDALVDVGCGEGYYTRALAQGKKEGTLYAFDISKDAAKLSAKALKDQALVFVGSAYRMPFANACLDGLFSLFAPLAEEEFRRVLKPKGYLIRVYPLPEHLFALKEAVYENPRISYDRPEMSSAWKLIREEEVKREILLPCSEDIRALFGMTPYAHKTGREDLAKLEKLERLTVETAFGISVYQKES